MGYRFLLRLLAWWSREDLNFPKDPQAPYTVRWTMYISPYTSAPENVPCYLTAIYRVHSPSATTSQGF